MGFLGKTSCFHRIYALLFLVELILRVLAEGCPFFWSSPNVVWNYLDTHGGIVELFCIILHILRTLFLSVFFFRKHSLWSVYYLRKGPSERIIQVVPPAPAFQLLPVQLWKTANSWVRTPCSKTHIGFNAPSFFWMRCWPFSVKVVCSKNHHPKKRAFNPEHDITPPFRWTMNPSAQPSANRQKKTFGKLNLRSRVSFGVSLEDVLIVLTSILNLVSEIASMTSLTSDAATRRFCVGCRWKGMEGLLLYSRFDEDFLDTPFWSILFDKGSKVWHLLHDAVQSEGKCSELRSLKLVHVMPF